MEEETIRRRSLQKTRLRWFAAGLGLSLFIVPLSLVMMVHAIEHGHIGIQAIVMTRPSRAAVYAVQGSPGLVSIRLTSLSRPALVCLPADDDPFDPENAHDEFLSRTRFLRQAFEEAENGGKEEAAYSIQN